jgi:hypothetical protein
MAQSKFVICPEGNGLDCHRTWEALLMGAIPVIKHSTLDPLFEGLPVLLVDSWDQVTEEFLYAVYACMKTEHFQHERMFARYWLDKILAVHHAAK